METEDKDWTQLDITLKVWKNSCEICYNSFHNSDSITCRCGHIFCKSCFGEYLSSCITLCMIYPLKCPTCERDIFHSTRNILEENDYERVRKLRKIKKKIQDPDIIFCNAPDCTGYFRISDKKTKECFKCHTIRRNLFDPIRENIIESMSVVPCPNCRTLVNKTFGCMYINCFCGSHFCLKCGKLRNRDHNSWECIASNKKGNVSWVIIFVALYSLTLLPLWPFLGVVLYRQYWDRNYFSFMNRKPHLYFSILFVFSAIICMLSLIVLPFIWGFECIKCLFYTQDTIEKGIFITTAKIALYFPCVLLVFLAILLGIAILTFSLPLIGVGLMFMKVNTSKGNK